MASYAFAFIRNLGAVGSSTPKPHILLAALAGNPRAFGSSTGSATSINYNAHRFEFDEKDISCEENLWNLYERWRIHYNVSRNPDKVHEHFDIFKRNAMLVHNTNKLNLSYTLTLNWFGDMNKDEKSKYRGYKPKPNRE